jgi:hypothetical protein
VTDGYDQALVAGGIALLRADASLTVYPGGVPNLTPAAAPPYVVTRATVEWPPGAVGDSLAGLSRTPTVRWFCYCVGGGVSGATPEDAEIAARAVAQRVRAALLNKRLVIAGMNLGVIKQEQGAGVPTPTDTTGAPVMELVVVYRTLAAT